MAISSPIFCKCGHYYVKNGKNKHGNQKYRCKKCNSVFTDSDRKVGRPSLFDKPLTSAEKTTRSRAKNKKLPD
jgi:transposase-like protein